MATARLGVTVVCAVTALVLRASTRAAEVESGVRTVALCFDTGTNLDLSSDALRLPGEYVQSADGALWFEAERASVIRFTPGRGTMIRDSVVSGGLAIAYADHVEFRFEIRTPGTYTPWYRALFPWAGHWNHSENMDGGETRVHTDGQGDVLNQWVWLKGEAYELPAGRHRWSLTPAGWCGGARLDKVVLSLDPTLEPAGLGEPAAGSVLAPSGQAVSGAVAPRHVLEWLDLVVANAAAAGTVAAEVSSGGGRWQPLPADGSLAAVPADRPASFRLTLGADATGAGPYVTAATVRYRVRPEPPVVLENEFLRLEFSGENGALCGLRNLQTQTDCLVAGVESPLLSFVGLRRELGTVAELGFSQAELREVSGPRRGQVGFEYSLLGGRLEAQVRVRLEAQLARVSLRVRNRSAYDLAQVRLLDLRGLRIGGDCTDDWLLTPITTGSVVQNPAALEYPRSIYTDRPLGYPGMATMCWMDLWDAAGGGLYLACEDRQYRLTELTFSNGTSSTGAAATGTGAPLPPDEAGYKRSAVPGQFVNLGFDKRWRVPPDGRWTVLPDVVLGLHPGDWHWGADRYREWAETWMRPPLPPPAWLRDSEGWTDCHLIHLGAFVDLVKGRPKGGRKITMADPPFPLLAMWAQMASCEAYWSTPLLHLLLGTEEEFRDGVQAHHELGHRFISYCLPSNLNPLLNRGAKRFGIVPRSMYPDDQVPPAGFYSKVGVRVYGDSLRCPDGVYSEATVCNAAPAWQESIRHIVLDKYIADYGNDGMYLDGAGLYDLGTQDCRSLDHGHNGFGEWTNGFLAWANRAKADARALRPGAILAGEGMGDVYMTCLDLSLFYADNAPEAYRYTFPENLGVIHGSQFPWFKDWPEGCMELATVYGLKFGGADYTFEKDAAKAASILAFREAFSQFQSRARFRDNLGLSVAAPRVYAKLYVRDEPGTRGALVVAFNPDRAAGVAATLSRETVGDLRSAWSVTPEGGFEPLPVQGEPGAPYRFVLPATELTAVLLLERCEPLLRIDSVTPVVPGETGQVRITVTDLDREPVHGEVRLGLPKGWSSESQPLALSAGASADFELHFSVPAAARTDVYDVYGIVRERGRTTRKCRMLGVCRPLTAQLDYIGTETLRLQVRNRSTKPLKATCRFAPPAGVSVTPEQVELDVAPGSVAETNCELGNLGSVRTREHLRTVVRWGDGETRAHELVQPPLLNGGFEDCSAGDDWPDYWNYRAPESLYLKGIVLDRQVFVEGRQSVRIDPNPAEYANGLSTTFVRLVPNARYRIRCSIRRTAEGNIGMRFFSLGAIDPAKRVDLYLGYKPTRPVGEWEAFEQEFTAADIPAPYQVFLANWTKGAATVWFDDVRIEPVR